MSLMFAAGERPRTRTVVALAEAGAGFAIGLTAPDGRVGCVELVANGLAFDLAGLAPGEGCALPSLAPGQSLPSGLEAEALEVVTLQFGPHLTGASDMAPVLRALAAVAARLALLPGLCAVAWHPPGKWSTAEDFRDTAEWWVDGPDPEGTPA
jgi:hypothetical protein